MPWHSSNIIPMAKAHHKHSLALFYCFLFDFFSSSIIKSCFIIPDTYLFLKSPSDLITQAGHQNGVAPEAWDLFSAGPQVIVGVPLMSWGQMASYLLVMASLHQYYRRCLPQLPYQSPWSQDAGLTLVGLKLKLFLENIKIYLYFLSFVNTGMAELCEILPCGRQGPIYPTQLHIEAETKWPPFSRRHFQMHFLEWKCMNFD